MLGRGSRYQHNLGDKSPGSPGSILQGADRAGSLRTHTETMFFLHNKKNIFIHDFFSLRIPHTYLFHVCPNAFQTRIKANGCGDVLS